MLGLLGLDGKFQEGLGLKEWMRTLKIEIEKIQKSCKHNFITEPEFQLKESAKKGVLKGFLKISTHNIYVPKPCYFRNKIIKAECAECDLKIEFSSIVICPKCFKETMKIKRTDDATEYIDDYHYETCDFCFKSGYGMDVYEYIECSCKVAMTMVDKEKLKKEEGRYLFRDLI